MHIAGITYALIVLFIAAGEIVAHRWIKKITNYYWWWLGVSVLYLIYCITVSWSKHWAFFQETTLVIQDNGWLSAEQSQIVSNAFLANICPFLNFAIPVLLIADPTRKAARGFAPLAIFGSFMVLFVDIPMSGSTNFSWQYVFIGSTDEQNLYLMGHSVNLFLAIGVLLNTPKMGWKGWLISLGQVTLFYIYVIIIKFSFRLNCYTAGISDGDFIKPGNFHIFDELGIAPAWGRVIVLFGIYAFVSAICIIFDISKYNHYQYGNKSSKVWFRYYNYDKYANKNWWWNNKILNRTNKK